MLFANSSKELEDQIRLVPSQYKVYTKGQSEEFFNARGEYVYDKTLHDNYIDHDMASRGISSRFFPQTDPAKIVNGWLQDHVTKENALIKQMVLGKYEKEVNELKRLGDQFTNVAGSKTGKDTVTDVVTSSDKNPYLAQVKAMLNITKTDEAPLLVTVNQSLDRFVSRAWNKAEEIFKREGGSFTPEKADEINNVFEELGFKTAYYDAATNIMANSSVPRGVLSNFVRKSNAQQRLAMGNVDIVITRHGDMAVVNFIEQMNRQRLLRAHHEAEQAHHTIALHSLQTALLIVGVS
jgi:hypothetical protein